jgi:hypothetical protein
MKILISLILSFIISHIVVTLLSYVLFFNSFNLAVPFLMVQDFLRPITSIIIDKQLNESLFKYSAHFTFLYTGLIAVPAFLSTFLTNTNKNKDSCKDKYGYLII